MARSWLLALSLSVVACSRAVEPAVEAAESDLVGGQVAQGNELDAVGAIAQKLETGEMNTFCNGTLIAERVVLTSKRCAELRELPGPDGSMQALEPAYVIAEHAELYFLIGSDSRAPSRRVAIESVTTCKDPDAGGLSGFGCNLALYHLAEPVTGVAPLAIGTDLGDAHLGEPLTVVSFGDGLDGMGVRRTGTVTLADLAGAPLKRRFRSAQSMIAELTKLDGQDRAETSAELSPSSEARLTVRYISQLLAGREAWLGGVHGDAQICTGDNGAPALMKDAQGRLRVYGVAGPSLSTESGKCPRIGSVFATFGPIEQRLVTSALSDPCGLETVRGRCDGDVAIRCTRGDEGERRATRSDCGLVNQHCVTPTASGERVTCGD